MARARRQGLFFYFKLKKWAATVATVAARFPRLYFQWLTRKV
jgi:hypothetical protein